ncbi:MAG: exodeoxyribonuclease VII large subunit [Bradymonadaceae bacterium]
MTRRIDIEVETGRLRIEFPYDEELVRTVKTLPDRRWDPDERAWFVPFDHVERVLETLLEHHFKVSGSLREYCDEHARPVSQLTSGDGPPSGPAPVPPNTLSISELNLRAEAALEGAFDDDLWIVGELQGFDRVPERGHAFFELVERPAEEADPVAKVRTVMFQGERESIEDKLADAPDDVRLRDGLAVRMRGRVDLYKKSGTYQFVVDDVDPTYTAGDIQRNRRAILQWLGERGIREDNLERSWPRCPLRVAVVTSWESDARRDFCRELEESAFGFDVTVHDAYVQGDRTEESVLRALSYFERHAEEFDALAIVRGGGARSDLAYFDTKAIGEAICEHPLKVVSGIGHQRDACLVDHVADAQKTPTAAAARFVEQVRDFRGAVDDRLERIVERASRQVERADDRLERMSAEIRHRAERRVADQDRRLSELRSSLGHAARERLEAERRRLEGAVSLLPQVGRSAIDRRRRVLERVRRELAVERVARPLDRRRTTIGDLVERLGRAVRSALDRRRARLDRYEDRLELLDPRNVLERGFALVRREGELVRSSDDAPPGSTIDVELSDGELRATVDESSSEDE